MDWDAKSWLDKKVYAANIILDIKTQELRSKTVQQSFLEFLDIWEFYWNTSSRNKDSVVFHVDDQHRERMR